MLIGAHIVLYSANVEADRALLRDVLGLKHVDAGGGWLIFALPPAELAIHPSATSTEHALYLMCADVNAFVAEMQRRGIRCEAVHEERWGRVTGLTFPGGARVGVYEPRHARPGRGSRPRRKAAKRPAVKRPAAKRPRSSARR
jgi:catechol 2,3-dioxygenase-like lactoylglutathione lyase family enzyme